MRGSSARGANALFVATSAIGGRLLRTAARRKHLGECSHVVGTTSRLDWWSDHDAGATA